MNLKFLAFILYFVAMLAIGLYFFIVAKSKSEKDYFLGGRSMGPWVTAMSAQASDMSGWLLMGFPGSILAFGFGKMWIGVGLAIGTALNWIIVAKRLRKFSKSSNDSITLPQYLSNRFCTKNPTLQIICAVVFLLSFTVYVASAFLSGAKVFTSVMPSLSEQTALIIFALIIIVYTFLGGFKAVCWTDFFQGLLMLIALLSVPIIIVLTKTCDFASFAHEVVSGNNTYAPFNPNPFSASWQDIISGLGWGLGYFGMPHILVRFMAIKKPSMVKKATTVSIVWVLLSLGAATLIAFFGRALLTTGIVIESQELVFIKIVDAIFPPFIAGILLSAIVAAAMSTADSQLLVASSSFTSDIYKRVIRKKASEKETMLIGRFVVLAISIIAYFIVASGKCGTIMDLVENAWGIFGASFGPVIILSLFWKRFTYKGAVAGILSGSVVDILWLVFLSKTGVYEIIPGFLCGLIFSIIVSLLDKEPSSDVIAVYENAIKMSDDEED